MHLKEAKKVLTRIQKSSTESEILAQVGCFQALNVQRLIFSGKQSLNQKSGSLLSSLQKNPCQSIPDLQQKLELKEQEMMQSRKQLASTTWLDIQEKNFHKSLDHKSFYFKIHDKQFTSIGRIEKEVQLRSSCLINSKAAEQDKGEDQPDCDRHLTFLNTFEKITNAESCDHSRLVSSIKRPSSSIN